VTRIDGLIRLLPGGTNDETATCDGNPELGLEGGETSGEEERERTIMSENTRLERYLGKHELLCP